MVKGVFLFERISFPIQCRVRICAQWWTRRGSNPRPYGCEPYALPNWATSPDMKFLRWEPLAGNWVRLPEKRGYKWTASPPSWAIGPNQQFQKRNRRIKQYEIIDVAENRTLCAPSWATSPNQPFFNQKSYEKQIFEIFGFEEKSRKTRLVNGRRTSAAGCSFIWLQTQRPPRWTMSPSSLSCNGR